MGSEARSTLRGCWPGLHSPCTLANVDESAGEDASTGRVGPKCGWMPVASHCTAQKKGDLGALREVSNRSRSQQSIETCKDRLGRNRRESTSQPVRVSVWVCFGISGVSHGIFQYGRPLKVAYAASRPSLLPSHVPSPRAAQQPPAECRNGRYARLNVGDAVPSRADRRACCSLC